MPKLKLDDQNTKSYWSHWGLSWGVILQRTLSWITHRFSIQWTFPEIKGPVTFPEIKVIDLK